LARVELPVEVDRFPQTRYCLVHLQPRTGRKHQLRRHMKHLGYPIIGDSTHGKGVHNRYFANAYGCRRLLLACTALRFAHPESGETLQLTTGPGEDFVRVLAAFDWLNRYSRFRQSVGASPPAPTADGPVAWVPRNAGADD
jgi:tRNA pseudouridine65 synthase